MKVLLLLCILAGTMSAQTMTGLAEEKVGLSGTADSPYLINGSAKTIVAYVTKKTDDTGIVSYDATRFNPKTLPTGLPIGPGESDAVRATEGGATRVHHDGTPVIFKTASLELVLFSDGTIAGSNPDHIFSAFEQGLKMDKPALIKGLLDLNGRKK